MIRIAGFSVALLLFGLVACGGSRDHGHMHGHGGHDHRQGGHAHGADDHGHGGAIVVTDFAEATELFVEFPPFAVGRESALAVHFTRLDTHLPVSEGEVVIRLSGGGVGEELFRARPSSTAGIFRPVVVPRSVARRNVSVELISNGVRSIHDIGEFQVFRTVEEAEASLPLAAKTETLIPFSKEQQWTVDFATAPVLQLTLAHTIKAPGTLSVSPNAEARVAATADGLIMAPQDGFIELGADVKRGDVLARITPRLGGDLDRASLDAERAHADVTLEAARLERERVERLFSDGAVPQRRLDEARAMERQAVARYAAARSRSSAAGGSGGVTVRAPIDGRTIEMYTTPGSFARSGDPLFRIINDDRLRLVARVAEVDIERLGVPESAYFSIPGSERLHDLTALEGRLIPSRSAIDPITRTASVVFEFDNSEGLLRAGASVSAVLRTSNTYTGPVIPALALIDEAGQDVVFVMADGEHWERRIVTIALRDGDRVGIASGLELGERVVSRGAYLVHLAASGPAEAGHGHVH